MSKVAVQAAGKCGNRIGFGLERVAGEPECSIRIEIGYHGDEVYQRMRRHLGRPVARVVLAVLAALSAGRVPVPGRTRAWPVTLTT
ncbi:hypothetical protein [Cupriavidus sp. MP-37]|uniref:hypothetical protein n=1 Tax=Cupriavidus sp. MP-37 TaxID=2884455 RepID=UPI001D0BD3D8|nr:hypothetical protein [Cupriavidus sp. MP-37]UDM51936.1 hypothetical protein LIN44_15880 [Cupriavidus sp. MP-37]